MLHKTNLTKKNKKNLQLGFGLIELMVSVGIIVLVMSVILIRNQSYNGAVLLRSQAYDIALTLREIQLSAVSVILQGNAFRNVLGVHFDKVNTPGSYLNFKDLNSDNFYNGGDTQIGKRLNLDKKFSISEIRLGNVAENDVSIVFERPNFDARFFTAANTESTADTVEIDIRVNGSTGSGPGEVRTVEVSKTGQITVKPTP